MKFKTNKLKNFQPLELGNILGGDLGAIDFSDALGNMPGSKKDALFLGRFSESDLMNIISSIGMSDHLNGIGFNELNISINRDDASVHYFKLYDGKKNPNNLLMDLRVTESKFLPDASFFEEGRSVPVYDMVVIEWLSAHSPKRSFDPGKPQLPGQSKPGLGILRYCFDMMYSVAREVTKDGFMDVPDHMHGAIMYSKKFRFFDPVHEAILHAIMRDLKEYSLVDISWGMITQSIIDTYKNIPQVYDPSEQIFSVSNRMKRYFSSNKYKSVYNNYYKKKKYRLDYDSMVKKREQILKNKSIVDL